MNARSTQWTEDEIRTYYNGEAVVYRLLWGRFSTWGAPANDDDENLEAAQIRHYMRLAESVHLAPGQRVLDIGSGDGDMILELAAKNPECSFVGVELSPVRVRNAVRRLARENPSVQARVRFIEGSALELPFKDDSFDAILSSAVFYHVPDTQKALAEAFRALAPGGAMAFDDLHKPCSNITEAARVDVYQRLGFDTDLDLERYETTLRALGFEDVHVTDRTSDMNWTYLWLARRAEKLQNSTKDHGDRLRYLSKAYRATVEAARRQEIGWMVATCRKPAPSMPKSSPRNLVREVYAADGDPAKLRDIYDVWASFYDQDLTDNHGWRGPEVAAACLARHASPQARILDVGAGTGSVGELLASKGFKHIVALDMSPGMLAEAARKGVYTSQIRAELGKPLPIEDGAFDHIVASGVFTFGHAPPEALRELCRVVCRGGTIVLTLPFTPSSADSYVRRIKEVVHALESDERCLIAEISPPTSILPTSEPDARHQVWAIRVL